MGKNQAFSRYHRGPVCFAAFCSRSFHPTNHYLPFCQVIILLFFFFLSIAHFRKLSVKNA